MKSLSLLSAGCCLLAMTGVAAPPKKAAAGAAPAATYWMDVTTQSGMAAGAQADANAIMAMMSGGPSPVSHMLRLRLASKTPAPAAPQADHLIPPGMSMGPSLPLVTPVRTPVEATPYQAKGKMLIYWGCGDHVGPGQPAVIDLAAMSSGKAPEAVKRMGAMMGRSHVSYSGPMTAPGFGEWPNTRDSKPVPPGASLLGAHKIQGNYSPAIDFTLGAGQDWMAPMMLAEAGTSPAGAALVRWGAVPGATGYALASFGATQAGEPIMWSSVKTEGFANLDYVAPGDVGREIASGNVLAPSVTQCAVPAEVVKAMPMGMVMSIAYGPEVHFAEAPKSPKWAVTVRYKATGSLMRGMAGMMGGLGR